MCGSTRGSEKALGAALADDLRAPEVPGDAASGWAPLPDYDAAQGLPDGARSLGAPADAAAVPEVLRRRIGQIGLVDRRDGARGCSRFCVPVSGWFRSRATYGDGTGSAPQRRMRPRPRPCGCSS
ncbi:MAG: hypothetical protein M9957_02835 [Rhodobacteraceae bacterium]|nr:hypothetical protein [Paracoccaceae bacterium]